MKIYKFGGASVKDADSIKNVVEILKYKDEKQLVVVISAMGKMTNAFEKLLNAYFEHQNFNNELIEIKNYHYKIIDDLFDKSDKVYKITDFFFKQIEAKLSSEPSLNYGFEYDQIIPYGEIISTGIVSEYFEKCGLKNKWLDFRKYLKTDSSNREANINWELSNQLILKQINFDKDNLFVIQGFIGSDSNNLTTTLGREGSDFTASVVGNILNAESVTVWKDVDGFFNIDPKIDKNATILTEISYNEAIELAFYGAKIIHPKTINPLKIKNIPLYVKSFVNVDAKGSVICKDIKTRTVPEVPVYIFKENQILISISLHDYAFLNESDLSNIFNIIAEHHIKINLMENSALSFSICIDYDKYKTDSFLENLKKEFKVRFNKNLELITIRCYDENAIAYAIKSKEIMVQQKNRYTARFVVKS